MQACNSRAAPGTPEVKVAEKGTGTSSSVAASGTPGAKATEKEKAAGNTANQALQNLSKESKVHEGNSTHQYIVPQEIKEGSRK